MAKQYVGNCYSTEPDLTDEEKEDRLEFEREWVKKFFEAECNIDAGEMYSFKLSRWFKKQDPIFIMDVLKDLVWEVEHLYRKAIVDFHKQEEWHDRNQRRSDQLRGSEDQPEAGQVGGDPDAGDPPK